MRPGEGACKACRVGSDGGQGGAHQPSARLLLDQQLNRGPCGAAERQRVRQGRYCLASQVGNPLANRGEVPPETSAILDKAGIRIETAPIARLLAHQDRLQAVELADGTAVPCEVMFTHPPQRQVALVSALGLALDDFGFVKTDAMTRETSVAGIYAAGDLTTRMQGAVHAAAAAGHAVAVLNAELTAEMAINGML